MRLFRLLAALLLSQTSFAAIAPDLTVELHAHLFMKEGMTWAFHGDFFGPLQARDYRDKFHSMANPASVEASRIGILVATLYAHPLFTFSMRGSIRRQVELARRFVRENPDWVLARNAHEARAALESGKRVMILALEGAGGILANDDDLREFVDEDGIRFVTPLHLTDDAYGGVAFLRGIRALASPWAWFKSVFSPHHDESDVKVNAQGLTDRGAKLVRGLIAHHVWIDFSHASDLSQVEMAKIVHEAGEPLLYTHTMLRRYHGAERAITDAQLRAVADSGGIIGLMPSEDMMEGTEVRAPCDSALFKLALQYKEAAKILPPDSIDMGSDYNGGVMHLKPACGTGTILDQEGLWNIGQVPALWAALAKLGAPVPRPLSRSVEKFLATWARVAP